MMMNKKITGINLFVISLIISGCEFLGPTPFEKLPLESISQIKQLKEKSVVHHELSNENSEQVEHENIKAELYPGTGRFVSQKNRNRVKKGGEKGEYSLNFDDADLGEVAKVILKDILAENYILSPKVAGKVTLQTTHPLTRAELLPTLEMLLEVNNAALIYQEGIYQIKPKAEASNSSFLIGGKYQSNMPRGHHIRVVPIRNVAVDELVEIVKPLMEEKTILHTDSGRNIMLVAGTSVELARAIDIINTFDIDLMRGRSFGLFPLQNVEAEQIIKELEQVFNQKTDSSSGGYYQFITIERLNSILAITYKAANLKKIERWIHRLDKANTSSGGGVVVYRVQHVDAVELAATLGEIFGQGGKSTRPASIASGRKIVKVSNKNRVKTKNSKKTRPIATKQQVATTSLDNMGEVKIIADETNNALIIMASAQDYAVVQRVIKQLDVMPLQVLVDISIVEVSLNDNLKYGIKWFFEHNNGQNAGNSGGIDLVDTATDLALAGATGGFGYGFVSGSGDIKAVLNMESTKDNINIISSPSLMVLNNQEASIQVGNEISLRTSEVTNTNSENNVTNTFQQRKTGVTVEVTPRVNASGLVIMEIEQKVEEIGAPLEGNPNPTILTREIKSSTAVQSGETIVLGGLISETNNNVKTGIPFLHEIPLIGPLFGSTEKVKRKTELVVLITPRVVKTRQDARLITNEFKRKLTGIYQELSEQPISP